MQSEWNSLSLRDCIVHKKGYAFKSKDYQEDGTPVVKVTNLTDNSIDMNSVVFVNEDIAKSNQSVSLKHNDIIIATVGSWATNPVSVVGKTVKVPSEAENALLNQNAVIIRPKDAKVDKIFLYYLLKNQSFGKYLVSNAQGSANQASITLNDIYSYQANLPPLPTQKKIAHILSTLDDKTELNRKMNETLEAMAQALFKSWFVDFDPVHLKARCQSEEELEAGAKELGLSKEVLELFPSEFVESEMGMIPLGWEVKELIDVVDFQNGYSFKSKELHDDRNNSTKVFKMGHIHRGGGFKEEGKDTYFYNTDTEKMSKYLLEKGDILMAMTDMKANMALLAHTALMPHTNRYLLNQRAGRLRVKDASILGYPYVYIFSNYPDTIHDLRSRSNSGVQVNLTTKAILDTEIIVPEQKVHAEFNKVTLSLYEEIFSNNEEIVNLQKTRDTLLPKLLSGELDVSKLEEKV